MYTATVYVNCSVLTMAVAHVDEMTKTVMLLVILMMTAKLQNISGARILLASPQIPSHVMEQTATGEELVQRGHEVYVAIGSNFPNPESLERLGLRTVTYHIPSDALRASDDMAQSIFSPDYDMNNLRRTVSATLSMDCEFMLSDSVFMEQVRALKFDLALVEPFAINPCVLLLPYNLNVRFVSLTNFYLPWSIRVPALPSFLRIRNPYINISTDSQSTFWNSLINTVIYLVHWQIPSTLWNNTLLENYSSQRLTWNDLILKSELFFVISDHHLESTLPMFPNVIPVPCITVRPTKPLPEELSELATQSPDGMILVTFGSMAYNFPNSVTVKFLEAFSRLQQTVIARLSIPDGVTVPGNVHVFRWLPQNDILAHQRTKLFITHCGSLGQHEALYHAVPMLGFPLFAEQPFNCERARAKGFGRTLNIHDFTSDELVDNIRELLDNGTYGDSIRRRSAALRDEPLVGPRKAAHWIEHVLKHGSAHLRSPATDLPLHRFLMLDVIAVLSITTSIVLTIAYVSIIVITRTVWRKLMHQPRKKKRQ